MVKLGKWAEYVKCDLQRKWAEYVKCDLQRKWTKYVKCDLQRKWTEYVKGRSSDMEPKRFLLTGEVFMSNRLTPQKGCIELIFF